MNNQARIDIILSYQNNPAVHPLTCATRNCDKNLVPVDCGDDEVILKCLDCGYTQHITDNLIKSMAQMDNAMRISRKLISL